MENGNRQGTLESQLIQRNTTWRNEFEGLQLQVRELEERVMEVEIKLDVKCHGDHSKESELLQRGVEATATMLTYLYSKARLLKFSHLASILCGMTQGKGLVDKLGIPFSECSENTCSLARFKRGSSDARYGAYIDERLKSTDIVTDVIQSLTMRVIKAETEVAKEKEKVKLGSEENRRKTLQIQSLTLKVEEMEKYALATYTFLIEMRQKFEDTIEETSRQRRRAAESERELMKRNFESLMSFVSCLICIRESFLSEEQLQTLYNLLDRQYDDIRRCLG